MDLKAFRDAFPEFRTAPDDLVKTWLDFAATRVDAGVFGASYDMAHGLTTAHHIALSPFGKNARLSSNEGRTTYKTQYDELRHAACAGLDKVI
jgi:hypothetical protein